MQRKKNTDKDQLSTLDNLVSEICDAASKNDANQLIAIKKRLYGTLDFTNLNGQRPIEILIKQDNDEAVNLLLKITDHRSEIAKTALCSYACKGRIDKVEEMRLLARGSYMNLALYKSLILVAVEKLKSGKHLNDPTNVLRLLIGLPNEVNRQGELSIRQQYAQAMDIIRLPSFSAMMLLPVVNKLEKKMVKHQLTFDEALFWCKHVAKTDQTICQANEVYNSISSKKLKPTIEKANKTKVIEKMNERKAFYQFKKAYFAEYYSKPFLFRNPWSGMKRRLNNLEKGQIISMDEIDRYASSNKGSRTAIIRNKIK